MLDNKIIIGIAIIVLIIVIVIIAIISKSKKDKNKEPEASILDVDEVGVPNTSELQDFSYGYEKEETIVMNPVTDENDNNTDNAFFIFFFSFLFLRKFLNSPRIPLTLHLSSLFFPGFL